MFNCSSTDLAKLLLYLLRARLTFPLLYCCKQSLPKVNIFGYLFASFLANNVAIVLEWNIFLELIRNIFLFTYYLKALVKVFEIIFNLPLCLCSQTPWIPSSVTFRQLDRELWPSQIQLQTAFLFRFKSLSLVTWIMWSYWSTFGYGRSSVGFHLWRNWPSPMVSLSL